MRIGTFILGICFLFSTAHAKKIQVVASFSVLAALCTELLGNQAEVSSLIQGNTDPHHFEPSAKDIQKLKQADLIVKNGLQFEVWMDRLVLAQNLEKKTLNLTQGLLPLPIPGTRKGQDPHAWLSAENALIYAANLHERVRGLADLDQVLIEQRYKLFQTKIQNLLQEMSVFRSQIKAPAPMILIAHESLSYLGRELGIQVISVHSYNIQDFDSGKKIGSIFKIANKNKIAAAFPEKSVVSPLFDRIVKENGLTAGEALYTETVPDIRGPNAFSEMIIHNVQAILRVLKVKRETL